VFLRPGRNVRGVRDDVPRRTITFEEATMQSSSPRTGDIRLVSLIPRDAVPAGSEPEPATLAVLVPRPVADTGYRGRHRRED
jgi:hypothetical protein